MDHDAEGAVPTERFAQAQLSMSGYARRVVPAVWRQARREAFGTGRSGSASPSNRQTRDGSPSRIRTYDHSINSRMLYR